MWMKFSWPLLNPFQGRPNKPCEQGVSWNLINNLFATGQLNPSETELYRDYSLNELPSITANQQETLGRAHALIRKH